MRTVILGAGQVGRDLGGMLSEEKHDVVILDRNAVVLNEIAGYSDVLTIEGNATDMHDLVTAGVTDADLVIAATNIDEVNMVASMLSKRLGAKKVIARIRDTALLESKSPVHAEDFGIDVIINPEKSVASEIVQLVKRAAASDILSLANDRMQLIGIRLEKESPIVGLTLAEYTHTFNHISFRVAAILRRGLTIIPSGKDRLQANDHIFVLALTQDIAAIVNSTGFDRRNVKNIMIAGGTPIGVMVAEELSRDSKDWNIKLIEPDYQNSYKIAGTLRDILVLNGNPNDPNLLASEGIMDTDVFIAVTQDEESNIISCLLAKHLKVSKVVALVSKSEYIPLSQTIGLDAAVNKKLAAANAIHRHVWKGSIVSVAELNGIKAVVLELTVSKNSKMVQKPLSKLYFPKGSVVGGILQNGHIEVATGNSKIQIGDTVIVFCLPDAVGIISDLF